MAKNRNKRNHHEHDYDNHRHDNHDRDDVCETGNCSGKKCGMLMAATFLALMVIAVVFLGLINSKLGALSGSDVVKDSEAGTGTVKAAPSANNPSPSAPAANIKEMMDDDAVKGSQDAPVTIVEFSDYECPYCGRFYRDTLGQIEKQYIDTGKVKLVYRDFPLGFHKDAQKAAEAAECAGEQGKYYEMHNLLFEKGVAGGSSSFKSYASEIGLDRGEFDSCLDSGKMASEIAKDSKDGQALGVRGTPAFFINGKMISGAQPFSVFKAEIEAALN